MRQFGWLLPLAIYLYLPYITNAVLHALGWINSDVAWIVTLYFSLPMFLVLWKYRRPAAGTTRLLSKVLAFSFLQAVGYVAAISNLPILRQLLEPMSAGWSPLTLTKFLLQGGVTIAVLMFPVYWLTVHTVTLTRVRDYVFFGAASGLTYAITAISGMLAAQIDSADFSWGGSGNLLLTSLHFSIGIPLLFASWAGYSAYWLGMCALGKERPAKAWWRAGAFPALLFALSFGLPGIWAAIPAVYSILLFLATCATVEGDDPVPAPATDSH